MHDFATVARELVRKYGATVYCSIVEQTCCRLRVTLPSNLPFIPGKRKGGSYDLSGFVGAKAGDLAARAPRPQTAPEPAPEKPLTEMTPEEKEAVWTSLAAPEMAPEAPTAPAPVMDAAERFQALADMAEGVVAGHYGAMVVSGNPGTGKTYTLEKVLEEAAQTRRFKYTSVKGFARATGLYRLLYNNRSKNNVILIDDCDSIFGDEAALMLLKAALDTTKTRRVSWLSEKSFKDDDGEKLPNSFDFQGSIIFVTNLDFEKARTSKIGPHLDALLSRSYYIDLNMRNAEQLLGHIGAVCRSGMLASMGLNEFQVEDVIAYIKANYKRLREVSLRAAVKLANIMNASGDKAEFNRVANLACCKRED